MSNCSIEVFRSFDDNLRAHWEALYRQGGNYNSSYTWCTIWFKYFGEGKSPYIITVWEEEKLVLLAPLYLKKNRLFLIGTDPTLFDEFSILYQSEAYFETLFDYIEKENLEIGFQWLNADMPLAKYMVRRLYSKAVVQFSRILETNPFWEGVYTPSKNLRNDVKKRKRRSPRAYNDEVVFEFQTAKDRKYLFEFIEMYKKRYGLSGLFNNQVEIDFIEDLYLHYDEIVLSRMFFKESDQSIAYHFSYLDTNRKFWSSMAAYDTNYPHVSPGKVLLFDLMMHVSDMGIRHFSFGRGSESYKQHCTNKESILFETISYINYKKIAKVKRVTNRILNKIV